MLIAKKSETITKLHEDMRQVTAYDAVFAGI